MRAVFHMSYGTSAAYVPMEVDVAFERPASVMPSLAPRSVLLDRGQYVVEAPKRLSRANLSQESFHQPSLIVGMLVSKVVCKRRRRDGHT